MISGFTFIHNAIESGYPLFEAMHAVREFVDEIVIVDMQSTDETREYLERFANTCYGTHGDLKGIVGECKCPVVNIINGKWGNQAGETLKQAHSLYKECSGDVIVHFEADEVYDDDLIWNIKMAIDNGRHDDIAVYRLQLEQNFQRCRWYPEPVHRVFPKNSNTVKDGHTTNRHNKAIVFNPSSGYLWDITNCFRDNWLNRVRKQAELWHGEKNYVMVPLHTLGHNRLSIEDVTIRLNDPHWTWRSTPFNIPKVLKGLVGMTKYEPRM